MATMNASLVIVTCLLVCHAPLSHAQCRNVQTSEGVVDLHTGDFACSADIPHGHKYVMCAGWRSYVMSCPLGLRWDNVKKVCNWPGAASCIIATPASTPGTPSATTATTATTTTTMSPATQKKNNNNNKKNKNKNKNKKPPPGPCSNKTCQLPACFCYGDVPAMKKSDIPMFIMLSFDDAVQSTMYQAVYRDMLVERSWGVTNPNNCPMRATFFCSGQWTDYSLVQALYDEGHEVADHTIHHTRGTYEEIVGMRDVIVKQTTIPRDAIKGFRSPNLLLYGPDQQFEVLSDANFTYDSSITNIEMFMGRPPLWPFTLDYPIADDRCPYKPCPHHAHPAVWEVPLNGWIGNNSYSCPMIDGCTIKGDKVTGSQEDYYYFFKSNFDLFYAHKVPMHMFTHASMFMKDEDALTGLKQFLTEVATQGDVWFVTPSKVIDWMKRPVTNTDMRTDNRFSC